MEDYRKQIDRLISKSDGEVVLNGTVSHAAMVIERMLARAFERVRILTRNLDPLIYCDEVTVRSAADFLRSGKELKILIEDFDQSQSDEIPYFSNLKSIGNLQVRQVRKELRDSIELNFSLMDDKGFRLEKDETGATAIVSFGGSSINERLVKLFDKLWDQSDVISLSA